MRPHSNPKMAVILEDLKQKYLVPSVQVLEIVSDELVNEKERYWVEHYYKLYPNLCNMVLLPKPEKIKLSRTSYVKRPRRVLEPPGPFLLDSITFDD
jgi:hypothetical protein